MGGWEILYSTWSGRKAFTTFFTVFPGWVIAFPTVLNAFDTARGTSAMVCPPSRIALPIFGITEIIGGP